MSLQNQQTTPSKQVKKTNRERRVGNVAVQKNSRAMLGITDAFEGAPTDSEDVLDVMDEAKF